MNGKWMMAMILAAALLGAGWATTGWAQDADPAATEEAAPAESGETDAADGAATDGAALEQTPADQGRFSTLWADLAANWKKGGPTMWALAFVAILGLIIVIDRVATLTRGRIAPHGMADSANELWQAGEHEQLIHQCEDNGSTLGKTVAFIVEHQNNPYDLVVSGAEDIAAREFELHTRRNYWLLALGTIAPLLGLMGTIFGLMGAFATIGIVGSMDDPSALAGDIGEAMITTATGLIIAIPLLFLYHLFRSRTSSFASLLSEEVSNLMHAWFLKSSTITGQAAGAGFTTEFSGEQGGDDEG